MRTLRNNALSIVLFASFAILLAGQAVAGYKFDNEERQQHGRPTQTFGTYLHSSAMLEATGENWESEFLQMGAYVLLTVFLIQRGSAESRDPDGPNEVDRQPDPNREGAPWPVRRGGFALTLYKNSLVIAFMALFLVSFVMHAKGGAGEYNEDQLSHGSPEQVTTWGYMHTSRFWFESLQNWQSEFLAVFSIVVLSIFLRQQGSPQSKPVDASHSSTGD